jgi:hypothetical protein
VKKTAGRKSNTAFGKALGVEQLVALSSEVQSIRHCPPLVTKEPGKYEGDILGFVRGLRLSARVIYFLRERLSHTGLEISWGHILDAKGLSCSPECDIIIHERGHIRKWNDSKHPIMEFSFINVDRVRAVVSCKSVLGTIDKEYPRSLRRHGVEKVFLFAECCRKARFEHLIKSSKGAGYLGLWCLYFAEEELVNNESHYVDFGDTVAKAVE